MLISDRAKERFFIAILILAFFIICGPGLNDMIIFTPDSARYVAWANSLASFEGFIDKTTPEPTKYLVHAPLYSVLLAPSQVFFPNSVVAAKALTLFFGGLTLYLFYRWVVGRTSQSVALAATGVLALNPLTFIYSTQVLSDIVFAGCLILFFILVERMESSSHTTPSTEWALIGAVVTAMFLREVGITVMLAATAYFVWRKKYRVALTIFLVSLALYGLWYVRNEVIIAGIEDPPLRNTKWFFSRLYADSQASLFQEFLERLKTNTALYLVMLKALVFFPEFLQRAHLLVSPDDFLMRPMIVFLRFAQYPLILGLLGLCLYGLWTQRKAMRSIPLFIFLIVGYLAPILVYPVNDIRFLYPLLPLILWAAATGWHGLIHWWSATASVAWRFALWTLLIVAMVPNAVWVTNVVKNNLVFSMSRRAFYDKIERGERFPEQFARPISLAAEWLRKNLRPSQSVASIWTETSFWLDGRPVVAINLGAPLEYKLRDYDVAYMVTSVSRIGVNVFESEMLKSSEFTFRPVHREGTVEVIEVTKKNKTARSRHSSMLPSMGMSKDSIRHQFIHGLAVLEEGNYQEADSLFQHLIKRLGSQAELVFNLGVAKEFMGNLDDAEQMFRAFRYLPQATAYLVRSWNHLQIISLLKSAETEEKATEKAKKLNFLAINYWDLAFRNRAVAMLNRSLEADPSFFPSLILHSVYSLQMGDTVASRHFLEEARSIEPSNSLVRSLSLIFQLSDSLKKAKSIRERNSHRISIAQAYIEAGLREEAIKELRDVLVEEESNEEALRLLAQVYEFKRRFAPALNMVTRLLALVPGDEALQKKRTELLSRW